MFPTFDDFYAAVHGRPPLPWQSRLARQVSLTGWPSAIGVPTGLGKTTCIDIAVWAIAEDSMRPQTSRRLPPRVWHVVNRRGLVDDAWAHSINLGRLLAEPEAARSRLHVTDGSADGDVVVATISAVGRAIRERSPITSTLGPLHVTRLRGGDDVGSQLPPAPGQAAVICSTTPMFGSRLLFRGYGAGASTQSMHTAMASTDSLVLLDEAHLTPRLITLVNQLNEADAKSLVTLPDRAHLTLTTLTATGDPAPDRFDLDETDMANDIVRQRLSASKPTSLVRATKRDLSKAVATATCDRVLARRDPTAALVFTNSPRRAPEIAALIEARLRKESRGDRSVDVLSLTGRFREPDAATIRMRLTSPIEGMPAGRVRTALPRHLIIVATQTLEVGADLDADVLVTETAGVRAMVQRFGRLNRVGAIPDAEAVVVHPADGGKDPLYGEEPTAVWERLLAVDAPNLGPATIREVLGEPTDAGGRASELLPNHLDEYVKTCVQPVGETPVAVFIEGIDDEPARPTVQVAWRAALPAIDASGSIAIDPPLTDRELVEVPLFEVRELVEEISIDPYRVTPQRTSAEAVAAERVRPGDQLIFDARWGRYSSTRGWDPTSRDRVADLSGSSHRLMLHPDVVGDLIDRTSGVSQEDRHDLILATAILAHGSSARLPKDQRHDVQLAGEEPPPDRAPADWVEELRAEVAGLELDGIPPGRAEASMVIEAARRVGVLARGKVSFSNPAPRAWSVTIASKRAPRWASASDDALDELSLAPTDAELGTHLRSVGSVARELATQLGLADGLVAALEHAGQLHDLGKAEPRFQAMLGSAGAERVLATSGQPQETWGQQRAVSGWPRGGRHEAVSVRMVLELTHLAGIRGLLEPDPELVLHLVASHHGNGRPSLLGVDDPLGDGFTADIGQLLGLAAVGTPEFVGGLGEHDWQQPARFSAVNERYGRRAVALLETVLRQADWLVSAQTPGPEGVEA